MQPDPEWMVSRLEELGIEDNEPIAVAVSGGADSMALLLLLKDRPDVMALTVDHGLRPESRKEAEKVASWCAVMGVEHTILHPEKPLSGKGQGMARMARYKALDNWCRENKTRYLLTAHHRDDQAETFVLQALRGSGIDGLAAMSESASVPSPDGYAHLLRPLLSCTRKQLEDVCCKHGQAWIDDPSNVDVRYLRTRVRHFLSSLKDQEVASENLVKAAANVSSVVGYLQQQTKKAYLDVLENGPGMVKKIKRSAFAELHPEIQFRVLRSLFVWGLPRGHEIADLIRRLQKKDFAGATLAGLVFVPDKEVLWVSREPDAVENLSLGPGEKKLYDHWLMVSNVSDQQVEIGPLKEKGWQTLVREHPEINKKSMPFGVILSLLAVRIGPDIVEVPALGYQKDKAFIRF